MIRGLLPVCTLVMMYAASPEWAPPRRIGDKNAKKYYQPCLGEDMRRGSFIYQRFS